MTFGCIFHADIEAGFYIFYLKKNVLFSFHSHVPFIEKLHHLKDRSSYTDE